MCVGVWAGIGLTGKVALSEQPVSMVMCYKEHYAIFSEHLKVCSAFLRIFLIVLCPELSEMDVGYFFCYKRKTRTIQS